MVGFPVKLAFLLSGLLIWAAHFLLVYAVNGLACARGMTRPIAWGLGLVSLTVLAATIVAVSLQALVLSVALIGRGPGISSEHDGSVREFWRFTTATIAGLSLVAVIWTAVPIFIVQPCG